MKRYDGTGNENDTAHALKVSPDGSKVFVTGGSVGSTNDFDYVTMAYDASTGARMWLRRYDGAGKRDAAKSIGVSPDGSKVFVTGGSVGSTSRFDYVTVAYDASTGVTLWVKRYDGSGYRDYASSVRASADGSKVFVTGESAGSTPGSDYATVAYDASTGATLWVTRYILPANGADAATALEVSPDASAVFMTGYSYRSTSDYDYATVAYDASTGARLWVKRYNGAGNDYNYALSIGVSPDGLKVFVTGSSYDSTSGYDYATVAYVASTGAKLWTRLYANMGNLDDSALALSVSPDGSEVFVTRKAPDLRAAAVTTQRLPMRHRQEQEESIRATNR